MRKAILVVLIAFSAGQLSAKVGLDLDKSSTESMKKDSKTKGFLLHKEKHHSKLTPVVDKSTFSVVEMGSCEVKIDQRPNSGPENRKYKVWVGLEYRLCQKVDFYQAKDVSYFGMIHRKGIYDKDDYRKTRYISQDDDEAESKSFTVGTVNFKSLSEIEVERNKIYQSMNSEQASSSTATLASLDRDEDILRNVLEQTLSRCEAHKEKILKNENRSNENFCEE